MDLVLQNIGDVAVVKVPDNRIDAASAIQFKERFRDIAPKSGQRVVLDLDGVGFVDSSGLGAIVAMMKWLAPNTALELAGMGETVRKVFALTRMDTVFKIHDDLSALSD